MMDIHAFLAQGKSTSEEAWAQFDALEPASNEFMLGRWVGSGLQTCHPMDGLLEQFGWYGKEFADTESVHPLIFHKANGKTFTVDPKLMPINAYGLIPFIKNGFGTLLFKCISLFVRTNKYRARLRTLEFRGVATSVMVYDHHAIIDVFRKVDENTLFCVMDKRGDDKNHLFFFILKRETPR